MDEQSTDITRGLPEDSDERLPPNATLEEKAKHKEVEEEDDQGVTEAGDDADSAKLFEEELAMGSSKKKGGLEQDDTPSTMMAFFNLTMPGVTPTRDDDYICTAQSVGGLAENKRLWIQGFSGLAQANRAHHMIVTRCKDPPKRGEGETWDCRHHRTCRDQGKIMFAWAKNAPATTLPPDAAFALDPDDYIVLQVLSNLV